MRRVRVMTGELTKYLPLLQKPARYTGGEVNAVKKDLSSVALTFGLAFPDAYEVGMSHLGMQILYSVLNSRDDIACERVYAPWVDAEALMREKHIALTTLESSIELKDLDVLGFSIQYELSYTNIINMLELGGIPLLAKDRGEGFPLVIGGGPGAFNPEPVADFFDCFLLGDGECAALEIADAIIAAKKNKIRKKDLLLELSKIKGVYVPSFFDVRYNEDGTVKEVVPLVKGYERAHRRIEADINDLPMPLKPVVPTLETVHDRLSVEIARGCTRGCRFCQAGMIYRPIREREADKIIEYAKAALINTGHDEVSLLSLSTGDYTAIGSLLCSMMVELDKAKVAVSLPSLRVGTIGAELASEIRKVRKTGFTLAPEAGTERMRDVINKGIEEEALIKGTREIFSLGWRAVKLYYMFGLPTETKEDVLAIVALSKKVLNEGKAAAGKRVDVNASVASFVPKPHTPFQWEPQLTLEEGWEKLKLLMDEARRQGVGLKWHSPETSFLEGVFSRGDRRLSRLLLRAHKLGARFDGWTDLFDFKLWTRAMEEEGVDPLFYVSRRRGDSEVLPWDHLDSGIEKKFLLKERDGALRGAITPDCKVDKCSMCGVCDFKEIKNVVSEAATHASLAGKKADLAEEKSNKAAIRYSKTGDARFLSHLELVRVFVRAFRRGGIELKHSEGFHPHPKISFCTPLPVGIESTDEYAEAELAASGIRKEELINILNKELPNGIEVIACDLNGLQLAKSFANMKGQKYQVSLAQGRDGLLIDLNRVNGFLRDFAKRESFPYEIERKGNKKTVDMRQLISDIMPFDGNILGFTLLKSESAGVKPVEAASFLLQIPLPQASLLPITKTETVF